MSAKLLNTEKRTYFIILIIFACFLFTSISYIFFMRVQNEEQSIRHLENTTKQTADAYYQNYESDFQILRGLAASLSELGFYDKQKTINLIDRINQSNSFVRMGLAKVNGKVDLLDLDGSIYKDVDLSDEEFFQQALDGHEAVSAVFYDDLTNEEVNYYMVPVWGNNGEVVGVLCAVHTASVYEGLLNASVIRGQGFYTIVNMEGNIVSPSAEQNGVVLTNGRYWGSNRNLPTAFLKNYIGFDHTASTDYLEGSERWAVSLVPLGINDWYMVGTVAYRELDLYYNQTATGATIIIIAACAIFIFFLYYQRKLLTKNKETLEHLAYTDLLTGARNYEKFLLDASAYVKAYAADAKIAVWNMDIKQFKNINDIFGSESGDLVLQRIADMLAKQETPERFFCRVSADRFVGLVAYGHRQELRSWFFNLYNELSDKREIIPSQRMHIDMAAGVYCIEDFEDIPSVDEMVNSATIAKEKAKKAEGTQLMFFTNDLREQIRKEIYYTAIGREAADNGEFIFYLQPKVSIQGPFRIEGAEVLVRWQRPGAGLVPPGDFVSLFEKSGLIIDLDRYIFEQACKWLREYLDNGYPPINLAVNLSRLGLFCEDYEDYYNGIKEKYDIPDNVLELELTESVIFDDYELFRHVVTHLQSHGMICAIDDFGSGYSSLNVIKNLPVDIVKLDAMFLREGFDKNREQIVISNFVKMAKQLNITTVAEGVESKAQVEFLQKTGCEIVQGYVFSKPVPPNEFIKLILKNDGIIEI